MHESLSPSESEKAKQLYADHKEAADRLEATNQQLATFRDASKALATHTRLHGETYPAGMREQRKYALKDMDNQLNLVIEEAKEDSRIAERLYDRNLARSEAHLEEHFPGYVEQARQDAESQSVSINLEQPKV